MENETKGGGGSFWKKESRLQLERNVFMEGGGVRDHSLSLSGNAKWKRITGSPVGNERWETTVSVNSITRGDLYRLKPFWTNVSLLLSVVFYSIFVSCALTSGFFFPFVPRSIVVGNNDFLSRKWLKLKISREVGLSGYLKYIVESSKYVK